MFWCDSHHANREPRILQFTQAGCSNCPGLGSDTALGTFCPSPCCTSSNYESGSPVIGSPVLAISISVPLIAVAPKDDSLTQVQHTSIEASMRYTWWSRSCSVEWYTKTGILRSQSEVLEVEGLRKKSWILSHQSAPENLLQELLIMHLPLGCKPSMSQSDLFPLKYQSH